VAWSPAKDPVSCAWRSVLWLSQFHKGVVSHGSLRTLGRTAFQVSHGQIRAARGWPVGVRGGGCPFVQKARLTELNRKFACLGNPPHLCPALARVGLRAKGGLRSGNVQQANSRIRALGPTEWSASGFASGLVPKGLARGSVPVFVASPDLRRGKTLLAFSILSDWAACQACDCTR